MADERHGPRGNYGPSMDDEPETGAPSPDGWVAVARAMRYHPLVGCGQPVAPGDTTRGGAWSRYEAWQDLIMECRYDNGRVWNGGRMMDLQPGQLLGAISFLAHRWNWTPKTVRNFLDRLETEGMISTSYGVSDDAKNPANSTIDSETSSSKGTQKVNNGVQRGTQKGTHAGKQARILTISNYSNYQVLPRQPRHTEGHTKGHTKGTQNAKKGQHYKEETIVTLKQESYPPTPQQPDRPNVPPPYDPQAGRGAEQDDDDFPEYRLESPTSLRVKRASATRALNAARDSIIEQAYRVYNQAADHWGFAMCEVLSKARSQRLHRRVQDIGGIEKFKQALRAVGRDDFLMGRRPPRPGQEPFRLTIDRLLQTDGGMGDVLARLLEQGSQPEVPAIPPPPPGSKKTWGWWRDPTTLAKLRSYRPSAWRATIEQVKPNGTWPWWHLGPAPGDPECLVPAEIIEERGWVEVYKGQLTHQ